MRFWTLAATFVLCGCSGSAGGVDAGADGASPTDAASDAAVPTIGCNLPGAPNVRPDECVLYYGLAPADRAEIAAKCVSPGSIVASCPKAGLVGICRHSGASFGKSNVDLLYQFNLVGGAGAYADAYRYDTTFGKDECDAAGGIWNK